MLRVLVACEESQAVCKAFRELGHEAYSCDLYDQSGGHPEWHIMGDCLPYINGNCAFTTTDGAEHKVDGKWDLLIAHPPCTYLCQAGLQWCNVDKYGNKAVQRLKDQQEAIEFFMKFAKADCDHIAIENPMGIMSTNWRKPSQYIHPYEYGHGAGKKTGLWLKI